MNDKRLIKKLKQKDSKALNYVIDKYSSYAYTVARNIMGDYMPKEDIEETVSDSFVSIWINSNKLSEEKPLLPYLCAIIRNNARNRLRNNKFNISFDEVTDELSGNDNIPELAENFEAAEIVYEAVKQFNNTDREVFIRYYFYGEKLNDIAVKTSLTLSNCKTKLCRTRKKIKEYLTERGYDYETKR